MEKGGYETYFMHLLLPSSDEISHIENRDGDAEGEKYVEARPSGEMRYRTSLEQFEKWYSGRLKACNKLSRLIYC